MERLESKEVLASAKFVAKNDKEQYTITLELVPSGCFDYGNRHALLYNVYEDDIPMSTACFDARYDHRFDSEKTFEENALDFVKGRVRDDLVVERIA